MLASGPGFFNGQANTTSRGNMSPTAAILNQPCPDVTRSFPRQLKCSLLCTNIQLMNTRGAFSNFASATAGHELKENCIIFRSIISQTSIVALSWAPSYNTEFCLDIFSVVLPQVFFSMQKRFTSKLVIAPASRRRSCLSYLHSLYRSSLSPPTPCSSPPTPTFACRRSHQSPATKRLSYHVCSLTWSETDCEVINQPVHSILFTLMTFIWLSSHCFSFHLTPVFLRSHFCPSAGFF